MYPLPETGSAGLLSAEFLPAELFPAELLPAGLLPAEFLPAELLPAVSDYKYCSQHWKSVRKELLPLPGWH